MLLQLFQQFSGINAIMFYAPVLFQTVGFGSNAALLSAVITGSINVLSTFVGIYLVDRTSRRFLLLQSSVHMLISQVHRCLSLFLNYQYIYLSTSLFIVSSSILKKVSCSTSNLLCLLYLRET